MTTEVYFNYNVRSFYDMYKINLKKSKISYDHQGNKHFFRYHFLFNDFLKKENIYFSKLSYLERLRIKFRNKFNVFYKIEYVTILFFIDSIKYLKFKFKQVFEIIFNKDYRNYLKKIKRFSWVKMEKPYKQYYYQEKELPKP